MSNDIHIGIDGVVEDEEKVKEEIKSICKKYDLDYQEYLN
jgi:hypothetical protein